jgi:hypothetical protein
MQANHKEPPATMLRKIATSGSLLTFASHSEPSVDLVYGLNLLPEQFLEVQLGANLGERNTRSSPEVVTVVLEFARTRRYRDTTDSIHRRTEPP